ncbi:hypothetical protein MNBD_GAMMA15-949 [hydrothermal vent metagenome]|uniref:Methyltransferase type 11 domain-containing protein n=1 Tax=hydrothermal vent metagenome TaxID=652676 RepID=A0A3B0YKU2_9ZZZZ
MAAMTDPAAYEAWYHTPRGRWIGQQEFSLLIKLVQPVNGQSLLDVGSGTGYFSRAFAEAGLKVTGIDPDTDMIHYAQAQTGTVDYLQGDARHLPFADNSFDYCTAVTSLCFVDQPVKALAEMWRVSRQGIVLGLLNRNSLLYRSKHNSGSYRGARWDRWTEVEQWVAQLTPVSIEHRHKTAISLPNGGSLSRLAEQLLPGRLPWGGFIAVYIARNTATISVSHDCPA